MAVQREGDHSGRMQKVEEIGLSYNINIDHRHGKEE